ncbi:MAG: hypothetical protein ACR2KO_11350 [Geodermatophilaceae bacterium]
MSENASESFEEQVPEEKRKSLVRRLMASGTDAPKVLLNSAIETNGAWASKYFRNHEHSPADIDDLVARVIKSHVRLARSEGASVAATMTAAEVGTAFGTAGTLTAGTAVAGLVGDLAGLAWIQTRMVLTLAAIHGHDPQEATRYNELMSLMGLYGAPQTDATAKAAGKGARRVFKRLILRHLKGDNLKAIKAMFDMVGIKFTRTGVIKILPFVNVPVSAVLNGAAAHRLGQKADAYYRTLPRPEDFHA